MFHLSVVYEFIVCTWLLDLRQLLWFVIVISPQCFWATDILSLKIIVNFEKNQWIKTTNLHFLIFLGRFLEMIFLNILKILFLVGSSVWTAMICIC